MSPEKGGALRTEHNVGRRCAFALLGAATMIGVPLVVLGRPVTAAPAASAADGVRLSGPPASTTLPPAMLTRYLLRAQLVAAPSGSGTSPTAPPAAATVAAAAAPGTGSAPTTIAAASAAGAEQGTGSGQAVAAQAAVAAPTPPPVTPPTPVVTPGPPATGSSASGLATWYQGSPRATGCASPTLPFGTVLHVTNDATGATATCVVDDREPYHPGRVLDLSFTVFCQLASPTQGVITVTIVW